MRKKNNREMLIFLDVDGVLNTTNSRNSKYEVRDENVEALGLLKNKLEKRDYEVKVILSTTWRLGYEREHTKCSPQIQKLISKLNTVGIDIYDKTPVYKECTRDKEIMRYIRGYRLKNEDFEYLILDDDISVFDKEVIKKMIFYKVSEKTGLVESDIKKILKMF